MMRVNEGTKKCSDKCIFIDKLRYSVLDEDS